METLDLARAPDSACSITLAYRRMDLRTSTAVLGVLLVVY